MNREEFADVFSQNIQITGGMSRVYSMLLYSSTDSESLVPPPISRSVLTVPVGNGFRISISKNEKKLADNSLINSSRTVRATRNAFSAIIRSAKNLGYKLCDLTLSRGQTEIVTVRNDPGIAEDAFEKYSGDPRISPVYLGFTNGLSNVAFEISMKISCTDYTREAGYLIYDAVTGISGDLNTYQSLQNAFQPKRSDDEISSLNPVRVQCKFEDSAKLMEHLDSYFSDELEMRSNGNKNVVFSSADGTWGEIVLTPHALDIYFRSKVDFNLGIRLLDALNREAVK